MSAWSAIRGFPQRHPRLAVVSLVLALALVGGSAFVWQREAQARRDWQQAQAAASLYDFRQACDRFEAYVRWRYLDAAGQFACARAYRRAAIGDFSKAREHLAAAQALGHPADEVALERALVNVQESGKVSPDDRFVEVLATKNTPLRPLILEALARGCIRDGMVNKANEYLDQWVASAPDDWYARWWRGCLFLHTAQPQLAIEDISVVLRHWPSDARFHKLLGLALSASGYDYDAATRHLEFCRQQGPADPEVLTALADCYRGAGRYDEARSLLQEVVRDQGGGFDTELELALLELDLGHDQAALQTVESLEKNGIGFDAADARDRMLALDPVPNPPALTERREKTLYLRAVALRRLARRDEAGRCLAELDRIRQLAQELKSALKDEKLRPQDANVMVRIGKAYLSLGLPDKGVPWLDKAIITEPAHREANAALAEYERTSKRDREQNLPPSQQHEPGN